MTEQEKIEKALNEVKPGQALDAVNKTIRQRNAQQFVESLGQPFTESQKQNFINILCRYEGYLDEINR